MNKLALIISLLGTLALSACSPWRFALSPTADYPIEGKILTAKDSVVVVANNAITTAAPAAIAFRCKGLTESEFNTEVVLERGSGFDMWFRSTPFLDSVQGNPHKLMVHVSRDTSIGVMAGTASVIVSYGDSWIAKPIAISPLTPFSIVVTQHGGYADVQVACVDVGRFTMVTPASEWITLRPNNGARVRLVDPRYTPIPDLYEVTADEIVEQFNRK